MGLLIMVKVYYSCLLAFCLVKEFCHNQGQLVVLGPTSQQHSTSLST